VWQNLSYRNDGIELSNKKISKICLACYALYVFFIIPVWLADWSFPVQRFCAPVASLQSIKILLINLKVAVRWV